MRRWGAWSLRRGRPAASGGPGPRPAAAARAQQGLAEERACCAQQGADRGQASSPEGRARTHSRYRAPTMCQAAKPGWNEPGRGTVLFLFFLSFLSCISFWGTELGSDNHTRYVESLRHSQRPPGTLRSHHTLRGCVLCAGFHVPETVPWPPTVLLCPCASFAQPPPLPSASRQSLLCACESVSGGLLVCSAVQISHVSEISFAFLWLTYFTQRDAVSVQSRCCCKWLRSHFFYGE